MQRETLFQIGWIVIATTVLAMIATGCLLWIQWFRGRSKRNLCGDLASELITPLPQPIPRWTVFDFLLMFGTMILAGSLMQQLSSQTDSQLTPAAAQATQTVQQTQPDLRSDPATTIDGEPSVDTESSIDAESASDTQSTTDTAPTAQSLQKKIRIHFTANLLAFAFTLLYLRLVHGATLSHLSLIPSLADFRRGLFATVWILTPVLLLNMVISQLVQYEHPVTDLLAQDGGTETFAVLMLSAAFLTPIVEEFQFRLLLQGGLQRLVDPPAPENPSTLWHPQTAWPIYVTSLFFALMHFGQGAAPIPLFFLSIGLGYLYQRTGRLCIPIIVHMLLNSATLCMEFCRVNSGL